MSIVASYSRTLPYVVVVQLNINVAISLIRSEAESMKGADTIMETDSCHSFRKLSTAREMLLRINSLRTNKKVKLKVK